MTKIRLVPVEEVHDQLMQDPEFKAAWEADAPQRAIRQAILKARVEQKITQQELANRAGIKQPSLARVESGSSSPTITTLTKLAKALNTKLEVNFRPL